jgi:O-antigen ligase
MKQALGVVLVAAALASVADPSGVWWWGARALGLALAAFHWPREQRRQWIGLGIGVAAVAGWGAAGLDWALVAMVYLARPLRVEAVAWVGAGMGCLGAITYLAARWLPEGFPVLAPFHNRNHYAVLVELVLPVLVYWGVRSRQRAWWAVAAGLVAVALAAGSRAGAVLLGLEMAALSLRVGGRKAIAVAAPLAVVAASVFVVWHDGERLRNPLAGDHRLEIWSSAWEMVAARPLAGWGAGEFARVYPQFARFDNGQLVNAAHSDWLEWLTEYGVLVGLLPLIWLGWWVKRHSRSYAAWGILVGALHAGVDFPFHLPGMLVYAAALAGSIEKHGQNRKTESGNSEG